MHSIRNARTFLFVAAATCGIAAGPASAQQAEPPRHQLASSWRTTVAPGPRPPRRRATPITTGALPVRPHDHALAGIASYYWQEQMTANGERFDKKALTAAHKTLPFGTRVRVVHAESGRSVVVRINDRGPFKPGRIIDLSEAAAEVLGMRGRGLAQVRCEVLP